MKPKFKLKPADKKKYLLPLAKDYEILYKIYELEKNELSTEDKKLVEFIRTQLEKDWRTPIVELLDRLLKKYK